MINLGNTPKLEMDMSVVCAKLATYSKQLSVIVFKRPLYTFNLISLQLK